MIEDIAAPLADPGRLIGLHFFNPVAQLPLVEVIRGDADARGGGAARAARSSTAIDKFPLIVKSSPGFLVNRVLAPYMMGAMQRAASAARPRRRSTRRRAPSACRWGRSSWPTRSASTSCAHVGNDPQDGARRAASKLDELVAAGKLGKKIRRGLLRLEGRQAGEGASPRSPTTRPSWSGSAASWSSR